MTTQQERYNSIKQELSQLSDQELEERWYRNNGTIDEMHHEADLRGYATAGEDYFCSDLAEENEVIEAMAKERGLSWETEGEEVNSD